MASKEYHREYNRRWYAANRERIARQQRAKYAALGPEQRKALLARRALTKRKYYVPGCRKEYLERTRGARLEHYRKVRSGPEGRVRYLVSVARKRAKTAGLSFNIRFEDLEIPTHCPVLGIPLWFKGGGRVGRDDSPSLDRMNNAAGYVKGNVQIISNRANRLKSNATADELQRVCDYARRVELLA